MAVTFDGIARRLQDAAYRGRWLLAFLTIALAVATGWLVATRGGPWAVVPLLVATIGLAVVTGYQFQWTGFRDSAPLRGERRTKRLWDWLVLLIVPGVLAFGVLWFNVQQRSTEREIALDSTQADALQAYLDRMSGLLVSTSVAELRQSKTMTGLMRTLTLTVLNELEGDRRGTVLLFLQDSGLIQPPEPIVDLRQATLDDAELSGRMAVQFTIETNGRISSARAVDNATGNEALATCVTSVVRRLRWDPGPVGGSVTFGYPFIFTPQN